jgi:hypothetical protein
VVGGVPFLTAADAHQPRGATAALLLPLVPDDGTPDASPPHGARVALAKRSRPRVGLLRRRLNRLRAKARQQHLRIRTAQMDDVVVVARLDAHLWTDDTATMRAKLSPPA